MVTAGKHNLPAGFERTCWRGIEVSHPAEWEPGFLCGPDVSGRCVFVDRRFQRLEVQWRRVPREPDVTQMYDRLRRSFRDRPTSALTGVTGWRGLVRHEEDGCIVHAGRHFADARCLVQAVLVWPQRRDRQVERAVLESIAPQDKGPAAEWRALGLSASVPSNYELASCSNQVGRVTWEFHRRGRGLAGMSIERMAMEKYWLKTSLGDWLKTQLPPGYRPGRELSVNFGAHRGPQLHSRRTNPLRWLLGLRISRVDLAWSCPTTGMVFRVGMWQRTRGDIDSPAHLQLHCCRAVPIQADME